MSCFSGLSDGAIAFTIFGGVFFLVIVGVTISIRRESNAFNSASDMTAFAKVVSRVVERQGRSSNAYHIAFEFQDGTRKSFEVKLDQYNTITDSDTGMLTYRENGKYLFFISFDRQA